MEPRKPRARVSAQQIYRLLFEQSPDGILLADERGHYRKANARACEMLGYSREEILKLSHRDLEVREDSEKGSILLETPQTEVLLRHKDGRLIPVELSRRKLPGESLARFMRPIAGRNLLDGTPVRSVAVEELRESEEKYRGLVDNAKDGITIVQEGAVKFVNPELARMRGEPLENILGVNFLTFVHPDETAKLEDRYRRRIAGKPVPATYETKLLRNDGTAVDVEISAGVITYQGRPADQIVVRDITERKQSEMALRESESRFRELWGAVVEGIVIHDNGQVLEVNDAMCQMFKTTREQMIGKSLFDFAATEAHDRLRGLLASGLVEHVELPGVRADGTKLILEVFPKQILYHGKFVRMVAVRDITERKRAEDALSQSEERYRRLVDAVTDYIYSVVVEDGRAVDTSHGEGCVAVTGYSSEEHAADPYLWYRMVVQEDKSKVDEFSKKLLANQDVSAIEHRIIRKDCIVRWVRNTPVLHRSENGKLLSYDGMIQDITERKRAEEELQQSRNLLQTVLDTIPARVFWKDRDLTFLGCNQSFALDSGLSSPREIVGKNDYQMGWREQADLYRTDDRQVMESGEPKLDYEEPQTTPDGRHIWLRTSKVPLREADGAIRGVLGTYEDISERKQAEKVLKASEERMRAIVEGTPNLFFYTQDEQNNITYVSPTVVHITGYPVDVWLKSKDWFVTDAPMNQLARETTRAHLRGELTEGPTPIEMRHADGHPILLEGYEHPIIRDGKVVGLQGVVHDVTERRRNETKIEEQARLLDVALDAIIVRDMDDKLLYFNHAAEQLYGWTFEEAQGIPASIIVTEGDRQKYVQMRDAFFEKGEWEGELRQKTKDGRELLVQTRWTLVRDKEGRPISRLIINRDVSEQRKLEAQFRRAQRLESLGTLAGGIAHDLNNVLAPITMSLALLDRKVSDPGLKKFIATLETSAQRGSDIIKQVLLFARGSEKDFAPQQLRYIIREIGMIVHETFPRNIEVQIDVSEDLRYVMGDATQLHQVLMNLCVNSRDAMPQGGRLTIAASNVSLDGIDIMGRAGSGGGEYVMLSIADTGSGIPKEIQEKIFEPFFTTKETGKGTGLGLSTVYAIVKDHGGFIQLYSEPDKGTNFKIYLPFAPDHQVAEAREQAKPVFVGNGEVVLVVDDEEAILEITSEILGANGYRVLTAGNGAEAVSVFSGEPRGSIHLVLTDLNMPNMDGITAVKAIRALDPEVKVIIASGLFADLEPLNREKLNIQGYLMKPYRGERMLDVIHEALAGGNK